MIQLKTKNEMLDTDLSAEQAEALAPYLLTGTCFVETIERVIGEDPKPRRTRTRAPKADTDTTPKRGRKTAAIEPAVLNEIKGALEALGPSTIGQLAAKVGATGSGDSSALKSALKQLIASGAVAMNGKARGTTYRLAG